MQNEDFLLLFISWFSCRFSLLLTLTFRPCQVGVHHVVAGWMAPWAQWACNRLPAAEGHAGLAAQWLSSSRPWDCANLWIRFALIPQRHLQLPLGEGSFPTGFVNEYNCPATENAIRTESSRGKRALFCFYASRVFKVTAVFSSGHTHSHGSRFRDCLVLSLRVLSYPPIKTFA